jgi:Acetyltransferase (GNAT) family
MLKVAEIVELNEENLTSSGCYCLRSKPNSTGYTDKNEWLTEHFEKGLKYVKVMENNKPAGFIEYAPIEHSSRVVYGENYIVIHCLWVHITGKGYASTLIEHCLEDAKAQQKDGVIVVTNPDTSWTPSKDIFLKHNFIKIGDAPYDFELLVHKFRDVADPYFPNDWEERLTYFNDLTILRTKQCPFVDVATENVLQAANKLELHADIIDIKDREQLMKLSPTPYGIYGVVYKNRLISFHRLTVHSATKRLKELI